MISIKKLRQIDCVFLLVFAAYTLDLGNLKYVLAALFALFYVALMASRGRNLATKNAEKIFVIILCGLAALFFITLVLQLVNGFQQYAINEAIYFITPLAFVWIYVNNSSGKKIGVLLDYMFLVSAAAYIIRIIPNFTIENLREISFSTSYSIFESGYAYMMIVFEWLYLYKGEKKKTILALVLCLLSFKRFCMVAAVLMFLFSKFLITKDRVPRWLFALTVVAFVILPIVTCLVMSSEFTDWFARTFGITLHQFTLSRSTRITMLLESNEVKYGLGSTTVYLTKIYQELHNSTIDQWNLHNDVVRIYMECGILGSLAFTWAYFKAVSFQRAPFVLMCYIFMESYVNHLFGAGSVRYWLVIYLVIAYAAEMKNKEAALSIEESL